MKFIINDDSANSIFFEEERIEISIKDIGKVILVETYPEYEFSEDVGEDGLEELNVEEGDLIGKIEHLEIEDKYKGKGYAKLLMNKAIEVAKEKGLMPLYLNASPMGSKRYGLDVDDLTGFYESLGFKVFLRQGGNNLMILKDTYKTGGETKNKIMAKQIKIQFADDNYANGGVTYSKWLKDNTWQEQFNDWKEDGNVSKNADGSYSTQDAQYTNRLEDMSALKRYFYNEFIKGQYDSYAGGGKAVKKYVVKGNVYDGGEIWKETFDNIDEAIELATEIQNGWSDDGTYYLITIYDEKGKKVATISDDKYFNELTENKLFKKVDLSADTKKTRQIENEKLNGYKFKLEVRIADGGATGIYEKTFDSIFDVMDKMNTYYEEDYYAYINNEGLDYWEDKYSEINASRNFIKGKYGWSFVKENNYWIAQDDYENYHIVRMEKGKPVSNSSITKGALKQIMELEEQKKYSEKPKHNKSLSDMKKIWDKLSKNYNGRENIAFLVGYYGGLLEQIVPYKWDDIDKSTQIQIMNAYFGQTEEQKQKRINEYRKRHEALVKEHKTLRNLYGLNKRESKLFGVKSFEQGGSLDNKHLIAKAIEYITGYAVETNTIQDEASNYSFKYKGRNVWSTLNSKLVNDTIRMHRKSLENRYAKGGEVKVDGLTKKDFIDAFNKRVENVIENLKEKGQYDNEDFDLLGEVDKQGGFTEIEDVGYWLNWAEIKGDYDALMEIIWMADYTEYSSYQFETLAHFFFGKPMKIDLFINSGGDVEYDYNTELQKIKLLLNKIDFDKITGEIDYEEIENNTNLKFYKDGTLVMSLNGDWNEETEELDAIIDIDGETTELNYHPLDSMGGLDLTQLQENINEAFRELNTYSAVVSIEGYEEYAEDVEGLENAKATLQGIKESTRFQVLKGSSVGIGKRVDDSRVVEEFAKGGEVEFDNEGTSMVLYHEKNGNWLVPKGQVYLYLYDVEDSGSKLGKEFDWVFYPLTAPIMAFQSGYIPPLKKIWTKKFQKDHKGSEHLLGVIKAYLIEEDGKKELFIDMMSVNPTKKKKGIMSFMIKELRESFNLTQDQVTFSKLTPEGEKFVAKKTYADGGETSGLITDEQVRDLSFKIKIENVPLKKGVLLHEIVTLEEFDLGNEKNINFYPFHLIYGDSSLAIFDAFGVDEVAGLKRADAEKKINELKAQGKTEKDGSFMAGLTNYVGDKLFMFFNVARLSYEGFANRVLPHEALHLSRNLISLLKNDWVRENLNTPKWWEDKRAVFVNMGDSNEEFFAETLERTTAIAMDGWFRVTGQKCVVEKNKTYANGGSVESEINELYAKSNFINDDFNWQGKLLEMLQDMSIEAYSIYQSLTEEQKEQVLQELYEMDNDMGSYGDGDIDTSRENLEILLEDAKNGNRYEKGGVTEEVYIEFMNKEKGFKKDIKYFKSYDEAVKWAKKNFENFHPDMINYK
jgi:GNAT superfamily N-acetyltransferase